MNDGFWYGERVVVTGCCGLIGRPVSKMLLDAGAYVEGYDSSRWRPKELTEHPNFTYNEGNVSSLKRLREVLEGAAVVIHLAAVSGVEQSAQWAYQAWQVNFEGTLNVMEAVRNTKGRVVVASSNHVYGDHEGRKTDEEAQLRRLDTYSATKIALDYMARSYAFQYRVPTVILRNTNCFGTNDPHHDHIIPGTIKAFVEHKVPVIRSSGRTKKSYLHVDDVARAYIAAAKYCIEEEPLGEVFNVTGEEPISTRDLVYLIREVMGASTVPEVIGKDRPDDVNENLDDTKIRTMLGWKPQKTLREAIAETADAFMVKYGDGVPV